MKNKIKNIINDNKNLLGVLCLFIIIQPIIDMAPLFENPKYQVLGFTIPTLVRCGFIGILTLISLKYVNKKNYKFLFIYLITLIIYTIFHHQIVSSSSMNVPDNYLYSITQELFYIIRMILPISIIYFTSVSDIDYQKFIRPIIISSAIIGTVIFIGNTFCISYVSYGNSHTVVNWIYWFIGDLSKYSFEELTSKGWFYMANQVSGLAMFLLPFNLYELIMNKTKLSTYSTLVLIISMIMLGTRTAAYGWIAIVIFTIIVYLYLKKIKKNPQLEQTNLKRVIIISFIGLIFLTVSPITQRSYGYELGDTDSLAKRPQIIDYNDLEEVYTYIEDSYSVYTIQEAYIFNIYNYKFDPQFWYDIFDYSLKNGVVENREMQTLISGRIDEINHHALKYQLFGYSFSRMRNASLYMEHDFIAQKFTMGYLGLFLLIGPYIAIMFLVVFKIIKRFHQKINFLDVLFIMSICVIIGVSILTGHIFDELFVTIYIGFVCGFFLKKSHLIKS